MSTRHAESVTRPSRRKLHISRIHASDPGWERNFQLPAIILRDLAIAAGHRIVRRRFLALSINVLNLLLLGVVYLAASRADADPTRTFPLAVAIFVPLWCAAVYLQVREAFDSVRVSGVLPWLNLVLLVAAPVAVALCILHA